MKRRSRHSVLQIVDGSQGTGWRVIDLQVGDLPLHLWPAASPRVPHAECGESEAGVASITIADSLVDGKSRFMAEVERLRAMVRAAAESRPVLFLIDEILNATNSHDRKIAAESAVRALVASGAVGALSTHDLALTEIAEDPALRGANLYMQNEDPEQPLRFDYRAKPGIAHQANALAIVRMMGMNP